MSFLSRVFAQPRVVLPGILVAALLAAPQAPNAGEYVAVSRPIPDVPVRALDSGLDVRFAQAIAGRPAVVLLTGPGGRAAGLDKTAGELQRDFGPWFSWVVVLSGSFTVADIEQVRDASQLRLERLYLDRAGALQAALEIRQLPVLLLVDQDGALHDVCSVGEDAARLADAATSLKNIAIGSRRRQSGMEDFRLPHVGREGLVSFLDVAGRESTLVSFIHSNCLPCARQLEILDFARDRHAGQTTFVAVFLDASPDSRVRGFLAAAGVTPDFVLRDHELQLAGRYGIDTVPALLVIDGQGRIVLTRSGYRDEERDGFYRDVETALETSALTAAVAGPALAEARRIHEEACAFMRDGRPEYALMYQERIREMLPEYPSVHLRIAEAAIALGDRDLAIRSLARYLAAQPQTYDSSQVRQTISGLLGPRP